jgi:hypothetical protein
MPTEWGIPPIPVSMVERRILEAMNRGEFENLPGAGKPIEGLDRPYDPGWWARAWIRRERLMDEARQVRQEAISNARQLRAAGRGDEAGRVLSAADREMARINRLLAPGDRVPRVRRSS